jgi:hypothetical protein
MLSQARSPRKLMHSVIGLAVAAVIAPCLTVLPASAAGAAVTDLCASRTLSSAQLKTLIDRSRLATYEAARGGIMLTTSAPAERATGWLVWRSVIYDAHQHRSVVTERGYGGSEGFVARTVAAQTSAKRAFMSVPGDEREKQAIGLLRRGPAWKDVLSSWDPDLLADAASFLERFGRPLGEVFWWEASGTCTSTESETVVHITHIPAYARGAEISRQDLRLAPSGAFRSLASSTSYSSPMRLASLTTATYGKVSVMLPTPAQVIPRPLLTSAMNSARTRDRLKQLTLATVTRVKRAAATAQRAPRPADVHAAARQLVLDTKDTLIRTADGVQVSHRDPLGGPVLKSRIFVAKNGLRTRTNL